MKTPHDDKIDAFAYSLARGTGGNSAALQLYETEDEPAADPVQWPKENPHLQRSDLNADFPELALCIEKLAEMIPPIIETIVELLPLYIGAIRDLSERTLTLYPNKRVLHLAKHGKKARTRKKNINRIKKHFEREARMHKDN